VGKKADRKDKGESDNVAWTAASKQKPSSFGQDDRRDRSLRRSQETDGKGKAKAAESGAIATGTPSSAPKTKIFETQAKNEIRQHEGKAEPAGSVTARKTSSSGPKTKNSESKARKQNGRGKAAPASAGEDGREAAKADRQAAPARKSYRSLY
jgi:hypothetical protein